MIQDITKDTIIFVGQVTNPLLQGPPIVSIPVVNSSTPIKQNGIISKCLITYNLIISSLPL